MESKDSQATAEENWHIEECIKGKRLSQEYLYKKYSKKLYHLSLSYTGDRDEAKDILQESFIKIFTNLQKFSSKGSFEGWARRILANTAIDHLRNSKKIEFVRDVDFDVEQEEKDEFISHIENTDQILNYIKRLPKGGRVIFTLFAIENYSHKQIAAALNISEGTSKSQYNRAKNLLRTWILEKEIQQ